MAGDELVGSGMGFGIDTVPPDGAFYCHYRVPQEGTYFFASMAAPAGTVPDRL